VQTDAHADRPTCEPLPDLYGRLECARCRGKGDEEGVSLRVHLDAALHGAVLAHDPAVLGERSRVRIRSQLVQQPRRTFDVREQKGDSARREPALHSPIQPPAASPT
jgi:hypothetical protein